MRRTILGALLLLGCSPGGGADGLGGQGPDSGTGGSAGAGTGGASSGAACVKPEEMIPNGCAELRPDLGECVLVAKDEDGDGYPGECEILITTGVTFLRDAKEPSKKWDCDDERDEIHPDAWDGPPIPGRPNRCHDDRDNDCSGTKDDGEGTYAGERFTCTCREGGPRLPCNETSQGASIEFPGGTPVGECKQGARLCDDGRYEECNGAVSPKPETCAQYLANPEKDFDCDGQSAADELDDPTDGVVDTRLFYCDADGDGRLALDRESVLSVLACAPPETGCGSEDEGAWIEKPQSSAFADCDDDDPEVGGRNQEEICDGKDNDCNESIDDDVLFPNQLASFECSGGVPRILECPAGKLSCDADILGNGCETDIGLEHCYDCEVACHFACSAITEECSEITDLALGTSFSCVQMEDGRVACFGEGSSGQLGDGQILGSSTPVLVLDLQNPQEIKAGGSHMCAIAEDSRVLCWGEGSDDQLSSFEGASLSKPDTTFAIDFEYLTGSAAISLGLGTAHSCAIDASHQLQCWGLGTSGQLGDGGLESHSAPWYAYKIVPDDYVPFDDAAEVTAGLAHTCARTTSGLVFCAGESDDGQTGLSSPSGEPYFEQVLGLTEVTAIAAGANHTCALENGKVYCWGKNDWYQVGTVGSPSYSSPQEVAGISTAISLASGGTFTCVLLNDGTVSCWGANADGQLGPLGPSGYSGSPTLIDGLTNAIAIEAGNAHVCALRTDHQLLCWGRNLSGQLGRGFQSASSTVLGPPDPLSSSSL